MGKDVTPYILKRVADLTKGGSLTSNIKLVENNAKVGAGVAMAVRALEEEMDSESSRVAFSAGGFDNKTK